MIGKSLFLPAKAELYFMEKQIASTILMIRPAHFGYNIETAGNNAFQSNPEGISPESIKQSAVAEFDTFVDQLRAAGVEVIVVEDTAEPVKPDAIFPNNWITTHADGTIVTYPKFAPTRRKERREDIIQLLSDRYSVSRELSLVDGEEMDIYLEGTGSMILDRPNRVVYACRSLRTDESLLQRFCEEMGYEMELFDAVDKDGMPIYHTNVMMALGLNLVVICLDSIRDTQERQNLEARFAQTGKEVINIRLEQMEAFAGNMLQVAGAGGQPILVMSEQAYRSLRSDQVEALKKKTELLYSPLDTIETYGGGSARCMMAEIFLPKL